MKLRIEIGGCPSEHKVFCGEHEITNVWIEHIEIDTRISPPRQIAHIRIVREEEIERNRMGAKAARLKDIYNGKRQMLREQRFADEQKEKVEEGEES